MTHLFHVLEYEGIIENGEVNEAKVFQLPFSKLIDIADASISNSSTLEKYKDASYTSSFGLGGYPSECTYIDCRLKKIEQLARFSVLYADRVIIKNFMADYSSSEHPPDEDSEWFRQRFTDDLRVLLQVRPLIEAGVIHLADPVNSICMACLAKRGYGTETVERLERVRLSLVNKRSPPQGTGYSER
jgi:hypothetical protein